MAWKMTKEYRRKWYWANRDKVIESQLKYRYGMTLSDLAKMERQQRGKCAVCQEKPKKDRLVVDHDHETGRVRGLLCRQCNLALGALRDSPSSIRRLLAYLRRTS